MKRGISLTIFLVIGLIVPLASASVFDWITGRTTEEKPDLVITDMTWSTPVQPLQSFVMSITIKNIGTAPKPEGDIVFAISTPLTSSRCIHGGVWSSLAPGESITKTFTFTCYELEKNNYGFPEGTYEITAIIDFDKILDESDESNNALTKTLVVGTGKTPSPESKEQVKCTFLNSNTYQKCYTSDGKFACSGIDSCLADVSGAMGTKLEWKSSCSGYPVYTVIDGNSEYFEFKCAQEPTTTTPTPAPTPTPTPTPIPTPTATPIPAETVKEQDRCIFKDSNAQQECHTGDSKFSCLGIGSCSVEVSGQKGAQVTWGSSCGGYDYTILDGNTEDAEFYCGPGSASTATRDKVKLYYFYWEKECPLCESEKIFLEQLKAKYPQLEYGSYNAIPNTTGQTYSQFVVSNLKQGMPTIFLHDKIWIGYSNSIAAEIENKVKSCLEIGCSLTPAIPSTFSSVAPQKAVATPIPALPQSQIVKEQIIANIVKLYFFWKEGCTYCTFEMEFIKQLMQKYPRLGIQSIEVSKPDNMNYFSAVAKSFGTEPSGYPTTVIADKIWVGYSDEIAKEIENKVVECIEKGCAAGQNLPVASSAQVMIKEQVKCVFLDSDVLIHPHSALKEKCYSDDGRFGCSWDGNVVVEENGKKYAYCIAEVYGNKGTKLTWKSSCGGYAYTLIDGNNEDAEFKCTPASEVKEEQITGKGFKRAYWQCYDDAGKNVATGATNVSCKPGEVCAVSPLVSCKSSEAWQEEAKEFCKGHCYKDGSKCGVNSFSVSQECYIDVEQGGIILTPSLEERKIEVKTEKVEEKEEKAGEKKVTIAEEKKEEILICKDSCPSDGKCYPFGYRKEGKYCSDEGAFKEQFKADAACENNFECSTNVCVDGKCMSSGLIQKIVSWFKKIFG